MMEIKPKFSDFHGRDDEPRGGKSPLELLSEYKEAMRALVDQVNKGIWLDDQGHPLDNNVAYMRVKQIVLGQPSGSEATSPPNQENP
jgi:hypothetical protein